jgi:hypothetical protein
VSRGVVDEGEATLQGGILKEGLASSFIKPLKFHKNRKIPENSVFYNFCGFLGFFNKILGNLRYFTPKIF